MIEPVRVVVTVECAPEHAFRLWTERMEVWWPRSHTMLRDPEAAIVVEPRVHGRIFERARDGREVDWGSILAWDPPQSIRYRWFIGGTAAMATDVSVTFTTLAENSTRVDLEQSGWERLGDIAQERRDRNESGWASVLPAYVKACGR